MGTPTHRKPHTWQHRAGRLAPPSGHPLYALIGLLLALAIVKALVEAIVGHPLF